MSRGARARPRALVARSTRGKLSRLAFTFQACRSVAIASASACVLRLGPSCQLGAWQTTPDQVHVMVRQVLHTCIWAAAVISPIASTSSGDSVGYVERTIALATQAVQRVVESPTPWFPVVATLCTGNGSLPGGCNAAGLPVATELSDLSFGQLVLGNTTGAARPTVMALWNAGTGAGKLSAWREQTQNDWVGDRMVPLPCQAPRVDDYVTADAALANVRKHTAYSNFISIDLRFPLDPCVSEPVFTCKCAFVHHFEI